MGRDEISRSPGAVSGLFGFIRMVVRDEVANSRRVIALSFGLPGGPFVKI